MLIKKVSLSYQDWQSDKVYEVGIVYLSWESYQVDFACGRRGTKFRTGTKNKVPISLEKAKEIFNNLVTFKQKKGYQLTSFQNIDEEEFLALTLSHRQEIIDTIKNNKVENFLEEVKKLGLKPREYWVELDLSNVDLSHGDLKYCNLYKTNLIGANLTGTNLQGAILQESQIDYTTQIEPKWRLVWELVNLGGENRDLRGINLSGVETGFINTYDDNARINLNRANLARANLSQADLTNFDFSNANLEDADLSSSKYAFFHSTNLENADLSDSCFDEGYFSNCICINANFIRASFGGEWVHFENANCTGANFQEVRFPFGSINGANFSTANFQGAVNLVNFFAFAYEDSLTQEVNFQNANFANTDLKGVNFCLIKLINLQGVRFDEANLENVEFSGLDLSNASFRKANLKGANLENCNLTNADLTKANLEDANLRGVDFSIIGTCRSIKINNSTKVDYKWQECLRSQQQI